MNFKEYLDRKDPLRVPSGSVIVTREDCSSILSYDGEKEVTLDFGFMVCGYTTKKPNNMPHYKENEKILFTTDSDGNPITASVFKLVEY